MNALPAILFAAVLLAINAFFVSAEFALISSRRDRLDALIAQGKTRARTVLYATEHLSMMLAGAQVLLSPRCCWVRLASQLSHL